MWEAIILHHPLGTSIAYDPEKYPTLMCRGTLSGSAFTPSLNITNYELGVLIPLDEKPTVAQRQATEMAGWVRPPRKYILSGPNVDTPWMQDVHI